MQRRKTSQKPWICTNDFDDIYRKATYIWRLYSPQREDDADQNQDWVKRESVGGNAQWPLLGGKNSFNWQMDYFPYNISATNFRIFNNVLYR